MSEIKGSPTQVFRRYQHLRQRTATGCGICSVLMAVSALRSDFIPDESMEIAWLNRLCRMRGGVPTFEIMKMVDSFDFKMSVWFEGSLQSQDSNDSLVSNYMKSLQHYQSKGSIIKNCENANIDEVVIIEELLQGNVVLLNGTVSGIPHMRACIGFTDQGLIIADPLEENSYIVEPKSFSNYFAAPYGKWMLAISDVQINAKFHP